MPAALREIVVDCHDPGTVARFWGAVLDQPVQEHGSGALFVRDSGAERSGLLLVFVASDEAKTGRNRLRVVIGPIGASADEEVDRLLGLGAAVVGERRRGAAWVFLTDPEDNEFCVYEPRPEG